MYGCIKGKNGRIWEAHLSPKRRFMIVPQWSCRILWYMQRTEFFLFHRVQLYPEGPLIYLVPRISILRRDVNDLILKLNSLFFPLKAYTIFSVRSRQIWYRIVLMSFIPPYHVKTWSDVSACSLYLQERKESNQSRNGFAARLQASTEGGAAVCPSELKPGVGYICFKVCVSCALVEGLWTVTATVSGWSISEMS